MKLIQSVNIFGKEPIDFVINVFLIERRNPYAKYETDQEGVINNQNIDVGTI